MNSPARPGPDTAGEPARPLWQRATLTYAGLFVFSAVAFGLVQAGMTRSVTDGAIRGLVFGILLSGVLGTIVVVGQRGNTASWSPRRAVTLTVPAGVAVAHRQALVGLGQLDARVTVDEPTRLVARTGMSWKTWGMRIDISFTTRNDATVVDLRVRPRVRTTLIDYGAAGRTVDTLTHYLTPRPPDAC